MTGPISERLALALRGRGPGAVVAQRYRLADKLGEGAMASVWLAHDLSLDAPCAVKIVNDDLAQIEEVRLRFAREAKVAAQLRGPHVVRVFDYGEWDGTLYLAMEWLQGEDLRTRLDRVGVLEKASAYRLVAHVARALMEAHTGGVVHRDLKPENIFLVENYEEEIAKVLDFGIARYDAYSLQGAETRTGSFLGTPYYVSPEQARGQRTDHRSDLWSLGVIAFQCLTGRPPFEAEALGELMGLILYEPLPMPSVYNPALPSAVDRWWQRACARDRNQRFQSAKELADELAVALGLDAFVNVSTVAAARISEPPGLTVSSGVFTPFSRRAPVDTGQGRISRLNDNPAFHALNQTDVSSVRARPSRVHGAAGRSKRGTAWRWVAVALPILVLAVVAVAFVSRAKEPAPAVDAVETPARPAANQPTVPRTDRGSLPASSPAPTAPEVTFEASDPTSTADAPEASAEVPAGRPPASKSAAARPFSAQKSSARPQPRDPARSTYRVPARSKEPEPVPAESEVGGPNYGI